MTLEWTIQRKAPTWVLSSKFCSDPFGLLILLLKEKQKDIWGSFFK